MTNRDPAKVQIGHWYGECCLLDLSEILDEGELIYVKKCLQDALDDPEEDTGMRTWETLKEAVEYYGEEGLEHRPDLVDMLRKAKDE